MFEFDCMHRYHGRLSFKLHVAQVHLIIKDVAINQFFLWYLDFIAIDILEKVFEDSCWHTISPRQSEHWIEFFNRCEYFQLEIINFLDINVIDLLADLSHIENVISMKRFLVILSFWCILLKNTVLLSGNCQIKLLFK